MDPQQRDIQWMALVVSAITKKGAVMRRGDWSGIDVTEEQMHNRSLKGEAALKAMQADRAAHTGAGSELGSG